MASFDKKTCEPWTSTLIKPWIQFLQIETFRKTYETKTHFTCCICFPQDFLTPGTKRITHAPSPQPKPTGCGHGPELHFFQQHFGLDPSKIQGLDTHQGPENRVEDMASGVAKPVVVKNGGVMGGEVGVVWFFLFFRCYNMLYRYKTFTYSVWGLVTKTGG